MHYFILLTDECNLCCEYCRGKIFTIEETFYGKAPVIDETLPCDFECSLKDLYDFLAKDSEASLTFYGGEPLMRTDLVREMMDNAPVSEFMIQTNAVLLDRLEPRYVNKFRSIFASIDGDRETTDKNRGAGTYDKVVSNLREARRNGYTGEVIARMTISENNDIYKSVSYLMSNEDFSFDSIHWQLDSNFWGDYAYRGGYPEWVRGYNEGIQRLADLWTDVMEKEGRVMMWYPFCDTLEDMLAGRKTSYLRCGSGFANYSIVQDGNIAPCPCMSGMKEYYCGNVRTSTPQTLKKLETAEDCLSCDIHDFCGGRCLYSNITKPWPPEGRKLVYGTVKNLKDAMERVLPRVKSLIDAGVIKHSDFDHVKYNGCEIIP